MKKVLVLNSKYRTDLNRAMVYKLWSHGCKALQVKEGDEVVIRLTKANPTHTTGEILVATLASDFYNSDTETHSWLFGEIYPAHVKLKDMRIMHMDDYPHSEKLKKTRANMSGLAYMEI